MRHTLAWAALSVPLLMLASPLSAQKVDKLDKDAEKKEEKWVKAGQITGELVQVYDETRKMRIKVGYPKPNPNEMQAYQQQQLNLARANNAQEAYNARKAMAEHQSRFYSVEYKEIEVQAIEEIVVRAGKPREDFDDKGRVKRLTREELKAQKGDNPKLPGYTAEFGDLKGGQLVALTVVRKKGAPAMKAQPRPKIKGKDADNADLAGLLEENIPQISQIIFENKPQPPTKR